MPVNSTSPGPSLRRSKNVGDQINRFNDLMHSMQSPALPRGTAPSDPSESRRRRELMGAIQYAPPHAVVPVRAVSSSATALPTKDGMPDDLLQRVVGRHRDRNVVTASEDQHSHTGGGFLGSGKPAKDVPAFRLEQYAALLASTSDIGEAAESITTANRILDAKSTVSNYLHRYEINQLKRRTLAMEIEEESIVAQRVVASIMQDGKERAGEMEVEVDQMERAEYNVLRHAKGLGEALGRLEDLGSDLEGIVTRVRDASAFAVAVRSKKHIGTCTALSLPSGLRAALADGPDGSASSDQKEPTDANSSNNLQMAHLARIEERLSVRTKALVDALGIISSLSQRHKMKQQKADSDKELRGTELLKLRAYTKALEAGPGFTSSWDWRNGNGSDALFADDDDSDKKLRGILSAALSEMGGRVAPLERSLNSSSFASGDGHDFFLPLDSTNSTAYSSPIATGRRRSPSHASLFGDTRRGVGGGTTSNSANAINLSYGGGGASAETVNAMRQELEHTEKELKFARGEIDTWREKCSALDKSVIAQDEEKAALRESFEAKIGKLSVSLAEALEQNSQYEALKRANAALQSELDTQRKSYDILVAATIANNNNSASSSAGSSSTVKAGITILEEKLAETRADHQATLAKLTLAENKLLAVTGQVSASSYALLAILGEVQSICTRPMGNNSSSNAFTAYDALRVHHTSQNRTFDAIHEGAKDLLRLLAPFEHREGEAAPTPSSVLAAIEKANEIVDKAKPQYLLAAPVLPAGGNAAATAAFNASMGESVSEMERLSAARRKVLLEGLDQQQAAKAAEADGAASRAAKRMSAAEGSGPSRSLTIYVPPVGVEAWRTDLAYMESLVLRMVRMTGKFQQQHQRKSSSQQESSTTAVIAAANSKRIKSEAAKRRKSRSSAPNTAAAKGKDQKLNGSQSDSAGAESSSTIANPNPSSSAAYIDASPVSHCLYAMSASAYELITLVATPLSISIGLPSHRLSSASTPSIGNILVSTNTSLASIANTIMGASGVVPPMVRVTLADGTVADVADVLKVVMEDYKKEALRLHFRCIRRRITDRMAIHRHASHVLQMVSSCRARIEELAASLAKGGVASAPGLPPQGSALKKSVTINEGGASPLKRTASGRSLTQLPNTAALTADAAAAMEAAKAAVRGLLRAYQKLYPPILGPDGGTLQQLAHINGSAATVAVQPAISSPEEVKAIDLASRLKADRSAWALASMAKDLAAKRLEQEQEQRLHLDPANEVVHPLSSGAMNDEEFALMRLYGDRLSLLRALAPLAPKPLATGRKSLMKSVDFDTSFAVSVDGRYPDEDDSSVVLFSSSGVDAFGSLFAGGYQPSPLIPAMASLSGSAKDPSTSKSHPSGHSAINESPLDDVTGPGHAVTAALPSLTPMVDTTAQHRSSTSDGAPSPATAIFEAAAQPASLLQPSLMAETAAIRELFREGISTYTRNLRMLQKGMPLEKVLSNGGGGGTTTDGDEAIESVTLASNNDADPIKSVIFIAAALIKSDVKSATQGYAKHYQQTLQAAAAKAANSGGGGNAKRMIKGSRLLSPTSRGIKPTPSSQGVVSTTDGGPIASESPHTPTKPTKSKATQTKGDHGSGVVGFVTSQPRSLSDAKTHASMETVENARSGVLTIGGGGSVLATEEEEALQRATALIDSWFNNDTDDGFGIGLASAGGGPYASQWGEGSTVASMELHHKGVRDSNISPGGDVVVHTHHQGPVNTVTTSTAGGAIDPIPSFYGDHAGQPLPAPSPSDTERILLAERVRRLEDQLKTTKIKMAEYLKELFTQKTFSFRPSAKVAQQRTVQILVSEPARFQLTRELPLPTKINVGSIVTGAIATPDASVLMDIPSVAGIKANAHTPARGASASSRRVSSATPQRTPASAVLRRGSNTSHNQSSTTELRSPGMFDPPSVLDKSATSVAMNVSGSIPRAASAAGARPKSGASVGLRSHLAAHMRRQASPTKDRGVSCDLEEERAPHVDRRQSIGLGWPLEE